MHVCKYVCKYVYEKAIVVLVTETVASECMVNYRKKVEFGDGSD